MPLEVKSALKTLKAYLNELLDDEDDIDIHFRSLSFTNNGGTTVLQSDCNSPGDWPENFENRKPVCITFQDMSPPTW